MTHSEYEKACVIASGATLKYEGEKKLAAVDEKIRQVEDTLVFLLHNRREIVNQYDLNKPPCGHKNVVLMPGLYLSHNHHGNRKGFDFCTDCGARIEL